MQDQRISTVLWRGKWIILACVAVGIALAIVATKRTAKVYSANGTIQVSAGNNTSTNASPNDLQLAAQGEAQTDATLIGTESFLQSIRQQVLGGALSAGAIQARIGASAVTNTALVQLSATGPSPEDARRLANDVATAFVGYIRAGAQTTSASQQSQIQDQLGAVSKQITGLESRVQSNSSREQLDSLRGTRASLQAQLANVIASGIIQGGSVRLTAPATASSSPISPRPTLNLLAGLLLGLLAGVAIAWLRVRLDRGLHGAEEAEAILEVPVLAGVPVRKRFSVDDPVLGEAYDVLRANLAFISLDQPLQVVTISSFNPREGKSSTVEGLAYAAGRGGMSVAVIDADVRTRTLSKRLRHEDAPGLTNVIVGTDTLDDALVELAPGISLLPSGPTPPNPPSLLASGRMRELLQELRGRFSLVLVDSPPVAHLADASILAAASDGVIVVARVGVTARADLAAAQSNLRHSPTPIVGVVLLERRTIDETYYPAIAKGAPKAGGMPPPNVRDAGKGPPDRPRTTADTT